MANFTKNNKTLKVFILTLTLLLFAYYYFTHQEQFSIIGTLSWWQVLLIIFGQSIVFISNVLIMIVFVSFIKKRLHFIDSARITAYSSLINFFGFLQGGVALRALYLKHKVAMTYKRYVVLTSIQYLVLFSMSALFIFIGIGLTNGLSYALIITISMIALIAGIITIMHRLRVIFINRLFNKLHEISSIIQSKLIITLLIVMLLQLIGSMLANFVELQAIGANVTLGGLLVYTGVAQFAVVIAITPGAIGIREALLLIAQNQMDLTSQDIILAATVDRIVYVITLVLLAPLAIGIKKRLPIAED